jgi:hypothetical protein
MKKLLSIIAVSAIVSVVLFACKNREAGISTQATVLKYEDTVGLAQFQSWKAMNERAQFENYMNSQSAAAPVARASKTVRRSSGSSGTMTSSSTNYAKSKKGWSKAAKYAAIGGGSGIVLGAVINKRNRVAGGAIGGVLGGGLGYVLGRAKDKKEGRY